MPWPSIDPGKLRHTITFLQQVTTSDISGMGTAWVPASPPLTARAGVEVSRAKDVIGSGQDISQVYAKWTIRYQQGILPSTRFMAEQGSIWVVQAINNVEDRNVLLEMTCLGLGANE